MRAALACAAVALVSACGTTVPLTSQAGPDSLGGAPTSGAGTGTTGATTGLTAPGTGAVPNGPASGGTTGTGTRAGTTGGTTGVRPGTTGAVPAAQGTVEVGFFVIRDVGAATKALGYDGLSTGNGANQVRASVALLNSRGGLNGATVKPVILEQDATQDAQGQYQAACSLFFDDHKVAAVVSWGLTPTLQECALRNRVPFITSGNRTTSAAELGRYPNAVLPPQLELGRVVGALIPSLSAQGYFKPRSAAEQVKVGLLYNADPDFAQVPEMVRGELKKLGLTLTDSQAMPGTDDTSRVPAASNAGSNAVLRFSANRITHVLALDKSGQAVAYFSIAAQNQAYYPQLGLSSLSLPASLRTVLQPRQLQGARGIGWMPSWDTPVSKAPPLTSNGSACVNALTKAGENMTLAATRGSALATCDSTLLLGAALKGRELTLAGFLSGLAALGRSWPAVASLGSDFTGGRDGASRFRPMAFQSACDCFLYTGPLTGAAR